MGNLLSQGTAETASPFKPRGIFNILPAFGQQKLHRCQQGFRHSDNMGLLTVRAATKRFGRVGLDLFWMSRVVVGSDHGCYKRGYDAVKLAGTAHLWVDVAKVAQVTSIASVVRNAKIRW